MNFSSDAMADFEGLLEVNRKICQQQMAEKASPTLPTNCAVLPEIAFFTNESLRTAFAALFDRKAARRLDIFLPSIVLLDEILYGR